jgi:hypothetical protein
MMKTTYKRVRQIIKEEISRKLSEGISSTPTGRLEVEWDFEMDDDPEWQALTYEEQHARADLPDVIQVSPDIMEEYMSISMEESSAEADYMINDWLSDEFGWLHQGWSWVDDAATQGSAPDPVEDEEAYAVGRPWEHN